MRRNIGVLRNIESLQAAQEEAAAASTVVTDEGTFLSNLLHQIMPIVSQHLNGTTNAMEDTPAQPSSTVSALFCFALFFGLNVSE